MALTPSYGLLAHKPVSAWNAALQTNFKDLFRALAKVTVNAITGGWDKVALGMVDVVLAAKPEDDLPGMAWLLIRRSLVKALYGLVEEHREVIRTAPADIEALCDALDLSLENAELRLDHRFFEHPAELPLLEDIQVPFGQWLRDFGLDEAQARAICARVRSYFVFALREVWTQPDFNAKALQNAIDTPFMKANEREYAWLRYNAWLQKQVDEPMFYEAFSLTQVYIPLRAYDVETSTDGALEEVERKPSQVGTSPPIRHVLDLKTALTRWVNEADQQDAIRVISGGPGCGKSSFVKVLAAGLAQAGEPRVLVVPLHRLDASQDIVQAVGTFVRYDGFLPHNPLDLDSAESRILIVFDGLDELALQGRVAEQIAQKFVAEVRQEVLRRNAHGPRLQVLISGRELVVQANASAFRRRGHILHMLPYTVAADERQQYVDAQKRLDEDQRHVWWKRYGASTGQNYVDMPEALRQSSLDEITAQPLLNYLIALSFVSQRLDFTTPQSLNAIYNDLLREVYERSWAEGRNLAVEGLTQGEFVRILEEIGLAAWHGNGRTATVSVIEHYCDAAGLQRLFKTFEAGVKDGLTRLLTAFYFRQSGHHQGDPTFEFTHKSFGEYLIAGRIVRAIRLMDKKLRDRRKDPDDGWDEREALERWARLCGPTTMDTYVFDFLCREIQMRPRTDVACWQQTLCDLISFMLKHGLPMERLIASPGVTYQELCRQARNAEEALLAALHACAQVTQTRSRIDWPSETAFGDWITRLRGQRARGEHVLALRCLGILEIDRSVLYFQDFYEADLRGADLRGADLRGADLRGADLQRANLQRADLRGANLQGADLRGAHLQRADLQRAHLQRAHLQRADLQRADLQRADLQGVDLQRADLRRADLQGAHLQGADLQGAHLQGAHLQGAHLRGAHLRGTDLQGADLQGADLQGADLRGAELRGAELRGADLQGVTYKGPTYKGLSYKGLSYKGPTCNGLAISQGNKLPLPTSTTRLSCPRA